MMMLAWYFGIAAVAAMFWYSFVDEEPPAASIAGLLWLPMVLFMLVVLVVILMYVAVPERWK